MNGNSEDDGSSFYNDEDSEVDVFEMMVIYSSLAQENREEAEKYLQKLFDDTNKLGKFLIELQKLMKSDNLGLDTLDKNLLAKITVSFATRGEQRNFELLRDVNSENTAVMHKEEAMEAIEFLKSQEQQVEMQQRTGGVSVERSTRRDGFRPRGVGAARAARAAAGGGR
jgi:hypothetical protein